MLKHEKASTHQQHQTMPHNQLPSKDIMTYNKMIFVLLSFLSLHVDVTEPLQVVQMCIFDVFLLCSCHIFSCLFITKKPEGALSNFLALIPKKHYEVIQITGSIEYYNLFQYG